MMDDGVRFFRGLLIALPAGVLMWAAIIWLICQII